MRRAAKLLVAVLSLCLGITAVAQDGPGRKAPSVTMVPPPLTTIIQSKSGTVDLHFRIGSGFHINSNTPKSEFLIPTVLKISPPTDIAVGRISYPQGDEMSFPFAPDEKLSVYSGDFTLTVLVRPLHVLPAKYMLHGTLRYQACDNAACYPPKTLPVQFEVKIAKAPPPPRANPAQSPHAHR
jgi:hypothetical protein